MAEQLGMGVVGAGAIGITCALEHLSLEDVQSSVRLAAVCDNVPGRAKAAAGKYRVPGHYETLEDLLADRNVDAVTLCTPIGLHYEQGMKAIAAGKHVHFNKTMCTTAKEADELIATAGRKGVKLVASPGQMIRPYNRRLRRLVQEGRLGQLVWGTAGRAMSHYHTNEKVRRTEGALGNIDPTWYYKKPAGGPLYDGTVYELHTLTGLVGPARRVTALSGLVIKNREFNGKPINCEMDDSTFMLIDFGGGFSVLGFGTVLGSPGPQPAIYGTLGSILATNFIAKKPGQGPGVFGDDEPAENMERPGDHQPHVTGAHDKMREKHVFEDVMQLVDWVREGRASVATAEHARHVIDIIESSYRSAATGKAQDLRTTFPPPDELAGPAV